jgi:hypothetical protein
VGAEEYVRLVTAVTGRTPPVGNSLPGR